jgi:hypothetical protein
VDGVGILKGIVWGVLVVLIMKKNCDKSGDYGKHSGGVRSVGEPIVVVQCKHIFVCTRLDFHDILLFMFNGFIKWVLDDWFSSHV